MGILLVGTFSLFAFYPITYPLKQGYLTEHNYVIEISFILAEIIYTRMKQIFILSAIVFIGFLTGCGGPKKTVQPLVSEPRRMEMPVKDEYVPFTKDIYQKLLANKIDLKAVQYFVDQQLVLSRNLDNNKMEVVNGIIKTSNGNKVDEVVIPIYAKGICELVEGDGLRISFEEGTNFKFLNSKAYSPDNFIFAGANWKDGSCDIDYKNVRYRVNCGTCSSAADAKLVVKQSFLDNNNINSRTLKGRSVSGGL